MNAGIAAYVILTQNTDVTDIVGVNIFPEVAEQETATPFIVYQLQSVAPEDTHDGPSKLDEVRFEFLCYADTYALAADLGDKVRGALDRVSGTYNGVNVESVQFNDVDIDTIDAPRRFAQVLTFTFRIKRDNFTIAQGTPVTGAKIGDLYDVDVTGVTDGQVLAYDASVQEWQPADDAGGVTELGQLTDVQFGQGGPETGELLKYDGSEWTNDSIVKSEIGLGNVDNTSDANKPVSTATQTALSAKANSADFSNVDNTSDADKPISTATQTALNAKADTSAVPTDLNDLSDVTIVGTPVGNQALIYDATAGAFKSQVSYTNRFEDEVETGLQMPSVYFERGYSVKSEGDGIFIDPSPDTPTAGKVIVRKIYHKTGFISDDDVIGDYTLIHTFADDTAYADTVAVFDGFEDGATYGVPPFTLAQTWEEVSATAYLLDETFGSGAEAAYSTRQLRFAQNDCMVIRRASDSTTTTIGFDGSGNISEADIESFCTGTTCTVYQWLDQSGNGNTATAPSTGEEPTIYTGGALVKDGGKVAIDFDGSNDNFDNSTVTLTSNDTLISVVSKVETTSLSVNIFDSSESNKFFLQIDASKSFQFNNGSGTDLNHKNDGFKYLSSLDFNGATLKSYFNGYNTKTATVSNQSRAGLRIGKHRTSATGWIDGTMQELIYWNQNKNASLTDIESNIGDYFTQNTPLLDTYTGAAAAYSLRKLSSSYSGSAVEVYNGSSYADIGFNVFSELDTVALAAHCGSNDGFVSKWYDQSGNTNTAAQTDTARMPKIYDGTTGVVTDANGNKIAFFDTGSVFENIATFNTSPHTAFAVTQGTGVRTQLYGFGGNNSYLNYSVEHWNNSAFQTFIGDGSTYSEYLSNASWNSDTHLVTSIYNGTINSLYIDTALDRTDSETKTSSASLNINKRGSRPMYLAELILYTSDQDAAGNRTGIESNLNTFYTI